MIISKEIDYYDNETLCKGFIAFNDAKLSPKAGILVAHDWVGRSTSACDKAIQLAEMGYVGFALDMYGQAQLGRDKEHRRALMAPLIQNRNKLIARIQAAFDALSQLAYVDKNRIAALGYCFGGLCVLDLARAGINVKGVVSFHGLLSAPEGLAITPIKSKVLVLHGYDDPLVMPKQVLDFAKEMTERNADWQIHMYGQTAHSFTNPLANDHEMGLHYNKKADQRSWESTQLFLNEVLTS